MQGVVPGKALLDEPIHCVNDWLKTFGDLVLDDSMKSLGVLFPAACGVIWGHERVHT